MSNYSRVRAVIVGCGSIAKNGYQPPCLAYPKKISLHGYFDQNRPGAEELCARPGGKVYGSLDDVLADPDVEAVINLTTIDDCSPYQARHIVEIAERINESSRSGLPVKITSRIAA